MSDKFDIKKGITAVSRIFSLREYENDMKEPATAYLVDPSHVCLIVGRTDYARQVLSNFYPQKAKLANMFGYFYYKVPDYIKNKKLNDGIVITQADKAKIFNTEISMPIISVYSIDFLMKALSIVSLDTDHVLVQMEAERPMLLMGVHFLIAIAPRIDTETMLKELSDWVDSVEKERNKWKEEVEPVKGEKIDGSDKSDTKNTL